MRASRIYAVLILSLLGLLCAEDAWGQKYPERHHIRKGNRLYNRGELPQASASYREALQRDSLSLEAAFNLGDAQYAMGDYASAEGTFNGLLEREGVTMTDEQRADVHYNLGNAQFQQQKLQEALESYKSAMRLNPADQEAKFNYVYTKQLLEQQQQQQQQEQNQDQNQDQNQQNEENQPQNQQGDNKEQEGEGNEPPQDQPKPEQQPGEGDKQPQPQAGDQRRELSEQLLDAVQHAEDQTREKVDGRRVVGVGASGKNW